MSLHKCGKCDETGYHTCIANGLKSRKHQSNNHGKTVLMKMSKYRCRNKIFGFVYITVNIDVLYVDVLDYGVTDPRKGYLGSERWNITELITPAQAATDYENRKRTSTGQRTSILAKYRFSEDGTKVYSTT